MAPHHVLAGLAAVTGPPVAVEISSGSLEAQAKRIAADDEWALAAWKETLEAAPPPPSASGGRTVPNESTCGTPPMGDPSGSETPREVRLPSAAELRRLCSVGIPRDLRRRAWTLLLSLRSPLEPSADEYRCFREALAERLAYLDGKASVAGREDSSANVADSSSGAGSGELAAISAAEEDAAEPRDTGLIEIDLGRTFPSLGLFGEGGVLQPQLREVLHVYCTLPDSLPYRQGMSHLAAVLLLHLRSPHRTCVSLCALISGYPILRACVSHHVGPAVAFFEATLAQQLPAVATHLGELGVPTNLYLLPWLLTMFSRALPLSLACRIWDRVLLDGEAELFRAALALLKQLQPRLLAADFEQAVHLLHHLPLLGLGATSSAAAHVGGGGGGGGGTQMDAREAEVMPTSPMTSSSPSAAARQRRRQWHAALAPRVAEDTLLAAMARVSLPEADYEALLAQCIMHQAP